MSQSEVNDIKQHINQLVLGSAQTYINLLKNQIWDYINFTRLDIREEIDIQAKESKVTLQVILDGIGTLNTSTLSDKIDKLSEKMDKLSDKIDKLSENLLKLREDMDGEFGKVNKKLDKIIVMLTPVTPTPVPPTDSV